MKKETQALLERYKNKAPVQIIKIAEDLGLSIFETSSFNDGQSGALRKEGEEYVIYVNEKHSAERKRFTIAHEIAHFLEHVSYIGDEITETRQLLRSAGEGLTKEQRKREIEANEIAADLLMPREQFIEAWNNAETIDEVANKFKVSASAAAVRGSILLNEMII